MDEKIKLIGIDIDNLTYDGVLEKIDNIITSGKQSYIVTVNPEIVVNAIKDKNFLNVINVATVKTADGIGIIWASDYLAKPIYKGKMRNITQLIVSLLSIIFFPRFKGRVITNRITGTDLLPKIAETAQNKAWRIFLLGASEGIAETVIKKFTKIYPKAQFVGFYSGTPDEREEKRIKEYINPLKPDILFVAYGSPKQENWINRNLSGLPTVKVAIGVGGAFDFHSGKIKRAPKFMRKIGLEWFWRLLLEPKRIKRIWNATAVFVRLIYKEKMKN